MLRCDDVERRDRRRWPHIIALFVLAVSVRFYRLGEQNLWLDEVVQVHIASQSPVEIVRNYRPNSERGRRDQAPLSFLVLHPMVQLGPIEWSARVPSAIFGSLDVLTVYAVGCEIVSIPLALTAALLVGVAPMHVWYSQDARWYAQWGWFTTLSYLAFVRMWRRDNVSSWFGYALAVLCGIYTFIFSFFVLACQLVSACWLSRMRPERAGFLRKLIVVHVIVVIACAPVLWVILKQLNLSTGTPRSTTWWALPYTAFAFVAGFSLGPTLEYLHQLPSVTRLAVDHPITIVVLATSSVLLARAVTEVARRSEMAAVIVPWCVGIPLCVFALTKLTHVTYQARYGFPAVAALMLLLSLSIHAPRRHWWERAASVVMVACMVGSLANLYWNARYGKEDVRGALAYVRAAAVPGARVIPLGQIDIAVDFYGRDLPLGRAGNCSAAARDDQPSGWLWIMIGRDWNGDAVRCFEQLGESYVTVEQRRFVGIDLRLVRRAESDGRTPLDT
ncbi:MAG TPA: glycosyltransferase family 39 protein [Candidatus Binatia bacterium]|nr:glycosyltransferase family 39 protein [Candidatus Binatia bacterium]